MLTWKQVNRRRVELLRRQAVERHDAYSCADFNLVFGARRRVHVVLVELVVPVVDGDVPSLNLLEAVEVKSLPAPDDEDGLIS